LHRAGSPKRYGADRSNHTMVVGRVQV